MMWEIGAPMIGEIYHHAKALGLDTPSYGYWRRKNREIPNFAKKRWRSWTHKKPGRIDLPSSSFTLDTAIIK